MREQGRNFKIQSDVQVAKAEARGLRKNLKVKKIARKVVADDDLTSNNFPSITTKI